MRRNYLRYVKKYRRFEKRHRNVTAHCSPAFAVKEGDVVTIGQCRYVARGRRRGVARRREECRTDLLPLPPLLTPLAQGLDLSLLIARGNEKCVIKYSYKLPTILLASVCTGGPSVLCAILGSKGH